jgi:glycogen phosphorylase
MHTGCGAPPRDRHNPGAFSSGDPDLFAPIVRSFLDDGDRHLILADYRACVDCQDRVARTYRDRASWTRKSIANTPAGHSSLRGPP